MYIFEELHGEGLSRRERFS